MMFTTKLSLGVTARVTVNSAFYTTSEASKFLYNRYACTRKSEEREREKVHWLIFAFCPNYAFGYGKNIGGKTSKHPH